MSSNANRNRVRRGASAVRKVGAQTARDTQEVFRKVNALEAKIGNVLRRSEELSRAPMEGAGRAIGRKLGHEGLGRRIGASVGKFLGTGDYEVHMNSLIPRSGGGPTVVRDGAAFEPVVRNRGKSVVVTNREFLTDIVSPSSAFFNQSFRINPADLVTFPWLNTMAAHYEQWRPIGMIFEYRPTSSAYNGTSQELGVVVMATDYDASDPAYSSKREMENSAYANSAPPHKHLIHGIECDPRQRAVDYFYTAAIASTASADARQQTLGNFQIATSGVGGTDVMLGELWVSYEVEFIKTQIPNALPRADFWYGTTSPFSMGTSLPLMGGTAASSTYSFPPALSSGKFFVLWIASGGTPSLVAPTYTNCQANSALSGLAPTWISTGSVSCLFVYVEITARDATILFNGVKGAANNWCNIISMANDNSLVPT
jgi:hypothetical protein